MRHIADNAAQQVDFILSTGDAVDPLGEQGYRNFRSFPRSAWEGDLRVPALLPKSGHAGNFHQASAEQAL